MATTRSFRPETFAGSFGKVPGFFHLLPTANRKEVEGNSVAQVSVSSDSHYARKTIDTSCIPDGLPNTSYLLTSYRHPNVVRCLSIVAGWPAWNVLH